jgi:hypothetical protein
MIEPLFIAPILGLLAKIVPVLGGVAAGVSAYQQIRESPGGARVQPYRAPGTSLATIPRTRTELERGRALQEIYTQNGGEPLYYRARRRMNVLNPRALRRSIRRVRGFSRFASRVGSYTNPGRRYKLKGFGRRRARR